MKENSIEEDIEILEKLLDEGFEAMCYEEAQAIKHILSDYKKLQEEFKQVDHECDRLEQKEIKLEKENNELKYKYNKSLDDLIKSSKKNFDLKNKDKTPSFY